MQIIFVKIAKLSYFWYWVKGDRCSFFDRNDRINLQDLEKRKDGNHGRR
jgi:hypothetical protein